MGRLQALATKRIPLRKNSKLLKNEAGGAGSREEATATAAVSALTKQLGTLLGSLANGEPVITLNGQRCGAGGGGGELQPVRHAGTYAQRP